MCNVNTAIHPNSNSKDNATANCNNNNKMKYFILGLQQEADRRASVEITKVK